MIHIEETVLGTLITFNHWHVDSIKETCFTGQRRQIYKRIRHYIENGKPVDLVILANDLPSVSASYLSQITDNILASEQTLKTYVEKLKESAIKNIADEFEGFKNDPTTYVAKIQEALSEMHDQSRVYKIGDVIPEAMKRIESAFEGTASTGISTGYQSLDSFFGGFQKGNLYVVAARPSLGKSALALNFAINASKQGKRVYMQWMEEARIPVMNRLLAYHAKIPNERISRGQIDHNEWGRITDAFTKIDKMNVVIDDSSHISSEEIYYRIKNLHSKEPIDLVLVDHLQLIKQRGMERRNEVGHAAGMMKSIAKSLDVPVVLLCQLSRSVEGEKEKRPKLSHLKESGDIEAHLDVGILLYRESYYNMEIRPVMDEMELIVAKNRDGRCGVAKLDWIAPYMIYKDKEQL